MRVDAHFSRFGVSFNCSDCGVEIDSKNGLLTHPKVKKYILRGEKQIACGSVGQVVKHPFMGMVLEN